MGHLQARALRSLGRGENRLPDDSCFWLPPPGLVGEGGHALLLSIPATTAIRCDAQSGARFGPLRVEVEGGLAPRPQAVGRWAKAAPALAKVDSKARRCRARLPSKVRPLCDSKSRFL